ncbi:hypothetical protein Tco_1315123 [Tanacetum coccineum]
MSTLPPGRRLCLPTENAIGLPPGRTTMSGNGYPRKGQKSKPKRQNQARERKERKKKSKSNQLSCLLKEQLLEPALNLTIHCCGLEFRVLNGYDQKSFDEERGLNCVVQTSLP